MSLSQLKKMSRRHEADLERLDRLSRDPAPIAVMPAAPKVERRVRYYVNPRSVSGCPIPSFCYRGEPKPDWPPVVGSPQSAAAKAAAEAEWRQRYGGAT